MNWSLPDPPIKANKRAAKARVAMEVKDAKTLRHRVELEREREQWSEQA